MKVKINQEKCISCGSCPSLAPEVFDFNDEGVAEVIKQDVPKELEEAVKDVIEFCPTLAIYEEK